MYVYVYMYVQSGNTDLLLFTFSPIQCCSPGLISANQNYPDTKMRVDMSLISAHSGNDFVLEKSRMELISAIKHAKFQDERKVKLTLCVIFFRFACRPTVVHIC